MAIQDFKCKYCGGELESFDGSATVGKCIYCGSRQTLPKLFSDTRATLFERANHFRRRIFLHYIHVPSYLFGYDYTVLYVTILSYSAGNTGNTFYMKAPALLGEDIIVYLKNRRMDQASQLDGYTP